jgi:hypothetical protein
MVYERKDDSISQSGASAQPDWKQDILGVAALGALAAVGISWGIKKLLPGAGRTPIYLGDLGTNDAGDSGKAPQQPVPSFSTHPTQSQPANTRTKPGQGRSGDAGDRHGTGRGNPAERQPARHGLTQARPAIRRPRRYARDQVSKPSYDQEKEWRTAKEKCRIGVIVDWKRCPRGSGWESILKKIDKPGVFPNRRTDYALADLIVVEDRGPASIHASIQEQDVLIINWDAANGDPAFGAHLALRWLEHRHREILLWVRQGNVLIIEGQAVLGVPYQQAYDALVGPGELPVCGPEDPQNPLLHLHRRMKDKCRKTKHAPKEGGFEGVPETIKVRGSPPFEKMFPGFAPELLTPSLRYLPWNEFLYRGWFRRVLPVRRKLPWVSILETADRGRWKNHSTMKVTRLDQGAIFATTMFLATTDQVDLVLAMLKCAGGRVDHLPRPTPIVEWMRERWKLILTLSAAAVGITAYNQYLFGLVNPLVQPIVAALSPESPASNQQAAWNPGTLNAAIKVALVPVGMLLFYAAELFVVKALKWVKDFAGY